MIRLNEVLMVENPNVRWDAAIVQFKQPRSTSGPVEVILQVDDNDANTVRVVDKRDYPDIETALSSLKIDPKLTRQALDTWKNEVESGNETTIVIDPNEQQYPVDIMTRYMEN